MTSKEVAVLVGCSYETISRKSKKALENNLNSIELKGFTFAFELTSNSTGKAYSYTEIKSKKQNKKAKTISFSKLKELENFDITKTSYEIEEKALIIEFYNKHNYSLNTIIKAFFVQIEIYTDKVKLASTTKKVKRWIDTFKKDGAKALEDKRGFNTSNLKINDDSLIKAVLGAGSRDIRDNFYGAWEFYNYIEAKNEGILDTPTFSFKNSRSIKITDTKKIYISYTAFVRAVKRLYNKNVQVKSYIEKGFDGLLQDYPVGIKDITYINQEWQVDSTKFDFMCKVTNEDGTESIKRVNVTAIIDTYSKKAIVSLTEKIDSYAQVRILYKAFLKMGLPELIYTDNGSDYVSKHYQRVLLDLGITQVKAKVGQGRQKGAIERFFGVTQSDWAFIPGYIANNVENRTKIENQTASKIDVRTSKATRIKKDRLLTLDELRTVVENLLDMKYLSYKEFDNYLLDEYKLENIRQRLGKAHNRKVQTNGIRVNNYTYQSSALWLKGLNRNTQITAYENIDDINEVYIYKDDKFICTATNRELGVEAMTLEEHKSSIKAYKKNNITPINKQIREATSLYEEMQDYMTQKALKHKPHYQKHNKIKTKKTETIKKDVYDEIYDMAVKFG